MTSLNIVFSVVHELPFFWERVFTNHHELSLFHFLLKWVRFKKLFKIYLAVHVFPLLFSMFALGIFSYQFIILTFPGHLYQISPLVNIVPHEIGVGSDQVHSKRRIGLVSSALDSRWNGLPSSSAWVIILYSRARQFTLIKPHSTEEYKLVPVNV